MKRIREIDLQKDKPAVACCGCDKQPGVQSEAFWVQVGFRYQCAPCARASGLAL